ncbi:MAG: T9SS type A sorting domain-containing protein [Candidatus Latescibacteria bacterium]|nr:T9SS type A sorting domain-containing protein [Candidatus Latescibacterota bacterium]
MARVACLLIAFGAIAAGAAQAATLTVQADGLGDYPTIQAGVDAALPGDTVLLAPGVYMGGGNVNVSYLGKGITVTSEDSDPATCIIDCQAEVRSPARGFTFDSGEDESAVLSCVTVREGMQLGGAVYCEGSSPTIERCIFLNNTATDVASYYLGGALMCYMAAPLIRDCEFIGNEAIWGGAIGGLSSTVHVLDCGFEGNTGGLGGAFYLDHDQGSKIQGCSINGGSADLGAGLWIRDATGTTISETMFLDNVAELGGGAIRCQFGGDAVVSQCLISSNSATQYGGGISCFKSSPRIVASTIVENFSALGAGLSVAGDSTTVAEMCVIAFNAGGSGLHGINGASVAMSCSDVFGNEGGNVGGELSDQTGLYGNISENPLFCDFDDRNFTLAEGSPCLPGGNDCSVQIGAFGMGCTWTGVEEASPPYPMLGANYPNPFNPSTTIPFSLDAPATVSVSVLDVTGRLVTTLAREQDYPAGRHELLWAGRDGVGRAMPSGVYLYRLETPAGATARPMLLVK